MSKYPKKCKGGGFLEYRTSNSKVGKRGVWVFIYVNESDIANAFANSPDFE